MAVLRSKRTLAYSEFERQMAKIHKDLSERMHALPARYKKHVCKKLYEPMNRAYDALILSDEQKGHSKTADEKRQKSWLGNAKKYSHSYRSRKAILNLYHKLFKSYRMEGVIA